MALADSSRAIGAVTKLLRDHLMRRGHTVVHIGRPEQAAADGGRKLNLFLYQTSFPPDLRNLPLAPGDAPPLWLTLHYLVTAFDDDDFSDSPDAQEDLGLALIALQDLAFLNLDDSVAADVRLALENNPEPLKLTFNDTSVDLLSKLMQGGEEKYRLSVAFEVRPVPLFPAEPPAFNQLVGVDYTVEPVALPGFDRVQVSVLPTLGPRLTRIDPPAFEMGDSVALEGEDLHLSGLETAVGESALGLTSQRTDRVTFTVEAAAFPPETNAAGEWPVVIRRELSPGRYRSSNPLLGRLLPTVISVALPALAAAPDGHVTGQIQIDGVLLGRPDTDDIVVALLRDGTVTHAYDVNLAGQPDQRRLTLTLPEPILAGDYIVALRVNNQQARRSPRARLVV